MAASTASSSKRKRTDQDSPPPAAVTIVETFSSFFNDPEADVLLCSSDGPLFATRRAFLVVASSVFDDMFKIPQSYVDQGGSRKDGQAAPGVLPVVEMTEVGAELEPFLRWIHRDTFEAIFDLILRGSTDIEPIADEILSLLSCARKYDVRTITSPVFALLSRHLNDNTANRLALAVVFGRKELARKAVHTWMSEIESEPTDGDMTSSMYNVRRSKLHCGTRPWSVINIWPQLWRMLPVGFFFAIATAEQKMLFSHTFDVKDTVDMFMDAFEAGFPI